MPHRGFQRTARFTLNNAISRILGLLYTDIPAPTQPLTRKTPTKNDRNAEIRLHYAAGEDVPSLARRFKISEQRIHQILGSQEE